MFLRNILPAACLLLAGLGARSFGQACIMSEPASGLCQLPRLVSGSPGQHVVLMDASTATGHTETSCAGIVGRSVWFEVTPTVAGPFTISTCHPATTYDTVIEVWSGGDSQCEFMTTQACNDDVSQAECNNGCSYWGSKATVNANAGQRFRFMVGAIGDNSADCNLCLGVIVTIGQPCGDAPTNLACELARPLPGEPGVHEAVVDVTDALVLPSEPLPTCGFNVGHTVWFSVTPTVDGPLTFSTCHPNTTFDTVVQAWKSGCELYVAGECNDDTALAECTNACGLNRGSVVSLFVHAGQTYYFQVGSYNHNDGNCELCLGVTMTLIDCAAVSDPVAQITSPPALGCVCNGDAIMGSAYDPDDLLERYLLEYKTPAGPAWTLIASSQTPVFNGVLANWSTAGLAEDWYYLRLTSENVCTKASNAVDFVRLGKQFDQVRVDGPTNGAILGGQICPEGTVWDQSCFHHFRVDYRPAGGGAFMPVNLGQPTYAESKLNESLATWSTSPGIADGQYQIRVQGTDTCGNTREEMRTVIVDNTAPIAVMTSPLDCDYVDGMVIIRGTANDAHLDGWTLQYTGGDAVGWVTINSGSLQVVNNVLGQWDVTTLRPCAYTLRLVASDKAVLNCNGAYRNRTEHLVSVNVGYCGDFDADDDSDVDLIDFGAFQEAFTGPE